MAAPSAKSTRRSSSAGKRKGASKKKPAARSRAARPATDSNSGYACHEGIAIALGGLSVMLFLALISYTPHDLPPGIPFSSQSGAGETVRNFIGPVGAITAGYAFFFFGAASYLIPAVMAWWTFQVLTGGRPFHPRNLFTFALLVVSAACLIEFQGWFFLDWPDRYNLPKSAGGVTGFAVGHQLVERALGPVGSLIVCSILYAVSLIVITGIHPFQFVLLLKDGMAQGWSDLSVRWASLVEERRTRREQALRLAREEHGKARAKDGKAKKTSREKKEVAPAKTPPVEEEIAPELPFEATPPPDRKIIDASQRKNRKLSREEAAQSLFPEGKKPASGVTLSGGHFGDYQLPPLSLLQYGEEDETTEADESLLIDMQNRIVGTLATFGVDVEPGDITRGPTITRYELYPAPGLRVNKITALQADIARATRAERINILAPVPGKDTVGIEIANSDKVPVVLRELFEDEAFRDSKAKLPLALGKDVYGRTIVGDLARMPHLLVAGATGSGKSVCINGIIASLLYRFTPDELRFIMIDPKVVEMQLYNELPHMVVPVVTDSKKVLLALRWVINEMEKRYTLFAKKGTRNFEGYNALRARELAAEKEERTLAGEENRPAPADADPGHPDVAPPVDAPEDAPFQDLELTAHYVRIGDELEQETGIPASTDAAPPPAPPSDDEDMPESLPYIVVIIDELADLMQTAAADVETAIARIAQKARAAGIHLIVATQTPRADVVTGIIKANIPSRIAFQVSSKTDSRIILDTNGAENLVGKGDMLYLPPGSATQIRAQGALITDEEAQDLVSACADQASPRFENEAQEHIESGGGEGEDDEISDADEELIEKCLEVVFSEKKASTSLLQRRLRLGYTRAARMIDILESRGIIGPGEGAKPREILVDLSDEPV